MIQLSKEDATMVVTVIDLVVSRGAIRGPEMLQVGGLRHRVAIAVDTSVEREEASKLAEDTVDGTD